MATRKTPKQDGNPPATPAAKPARRRRLTKVEVEARAADIVKMRRARATWIEIGKKYNISDSVACRIYKQEIASHPLSAMQVDEHRYEEQQMIETATRALMGLALNNHTDPEGKRPLVTARTKVEAWRCMLAWAEHKAKLLGLYAPAKLEVTTIDYLEQLAARMEVDMGLQPGEIPKEPSKYEL